jgi:hypothetical protein
VVRQDSDATAAAERVAEAKSAEASVAQLRAAFDAFFESSSTVDAVLSGFVQHVQTVTAAAGVYVGAVENADSIKYVHATPEHKFLVNTRLLRHNDDDNAQDDDFDDDDERNGPVTFRVLDDEEEEEPQYDDDELDEDGNPLVPPPEKPLNSVFVPDVLMGPDASSVRFHRLPRAGCYYAVRLQYNSLLNETSLDDADSKKAELEDEARELAAQASDYDDDGSDQEDLDTSVDEKTEAKLANDAKVAANAVDVAQELRLLDLVDTVPVTYVLSVDTLGQNRRLTAAELASIQAYCKRAVALLRSIDRADFQKERARRRVLATHQLGPDDEQPDEDDLQAAFDDYAHKYRKEHKATGDDDEEISIEEISYRYRLEQLDAVKPIVTQFADYDGFRGPASILQAWLWMRGYKREASVDSDNVCTWKRLRGCFTDALFEQSAAYNPSEAQLLPKTHYATIPKLDELVAELNVEDVAEVNRPLSVVLQYVHAALSWKKRAALERARARRRAAREARLKAEAEAEAAAEAAALAAEAAEGDFSDEEGFDT